MPMNRLAKTNAKKTAKVLILLLLIKLWVITGWPGSSLFRLVTYVILGVAGVFASGVVQIKVGGGAIFPPPPQSLELGAEKAHRRVDKRPSFGHCALHCAGTVAEWLKAAVC